MILTYRYRIKDRNSSARRALRLQARAVNFVWNFCCETDRQAADRWRSGRTTKRPSRFDLTNLCRGISKDLGIHSDTIDAICQKFAVSRDAIFPKTPRFRSYRRNLDWIPFSNFIRPAKLNGSVLTVLKRRYHLWLSRELPETRKAWSFSCDARGRWYANIAVEVDEQPSRNGAAIGIDLGIKDFVTMSDGNKIEAPAFYRRTEAELAKWQSFGKNQRVTALHAKIVNQRKHFLHVESIKIVRAHAQVFVGDVDASGLAKTRMAKSVLDAGWSAFRNMLAYKSIATGARFAVVNERYSTQTCSGCGAIGGPKGIAGLGIRHWVCPSCGCSHDRDVNAAQNILRVGLERQPLAVGIAA